MKNKLYLILFLSAISYQSYSKTDTTIYQYGYDSNGNSIAVNQVINNKSKQMYAYIYNNFNQMVGFKDIENHKSFSYLYYPDGRRLSKQGYSELDKEAIVFYYGDHGQLMNESYNKNNKVIKQTSYFVGLRFIDNFVFNSDSRLQFPLVDQHNHQASLVFSKGQSQIESYQITDYGQLAQSNIKQTDQSKLFNFELNPKVYGSGYYDTESDLQYMRARYYSANIQRFISQDSYNLLNRYNYANANPIMNYDADGHYSIKKFGKDLLKYSQKYTIGFNNGDRNNFLIGLGVSVFVGVFAGGFSVDKPMALAFLFTSAISGGQIPAFTHLSRYQTTQEKMLGVAIPLLINVGVSYLAFKGSRFLKGSVGLFGCRNCIPKGEELAESIGNAPDSGITNASDSQEIYKRFSRTTPLTIPRNKNNLSGFITELSNSFGSSLSL